MKKSFLKLIVILIANQLSGQTINKSNLTNLTKADLGLLRLGMGYELKLANKMTVDLALGAGGGYDIAEGRINYILELTKPAFYFSVTPKFYFQTEDNKSNNLNAGKYIGLRVVYATPNRRVSNLTRKSILTNIHVGRQKAIGENWAYNAHFGLGYAEDIGSSFGTLYPSLDFKIFYKIGRKSNK